MCMICIIVIIICILDRQMIHGTRWHGMGRHSAVTDFSGGTGRSIWIYIYMGVSENSVPHFPNG